MTNGGGLPRDDFTIRGDYFGDRATSHRHRARGRQLAFGSPHHRRAATASGPPAHRDEPRGRGRRDHEGRHPGRPHDRHGGSPRTTRSSSRHRASPGPTSTACSAAASPDKLHRERLVPEDRLPRRRLRRRLHRRRRRLHRRRLRRHRRRLHRRRRHRRRRRPRHRRRHHRRRRRRRRHRRRRRRRRRSTATAATTAAARCRAAELPPGGVALYGDAGRWPRSMAASSSTRCHERIGEPTWPEARSPSAGPTASGAACSALTVTTRAIPDGVDGAARASTSRSRALQLGTRPATGDETDAGTRDRAGVYAAFGHADADVEHASATAPSTAATAASTPTASAATGPAPGRTDWYVDGVAPADLVRHDHDRRPRPRRRRDRRLGPRRLGRGRLSLRPSRRLGGRAAGALVYQTFDIDDFDDGAADVNYSDTRLLAGADRRPAGAHLGCPGAGRAPQPARPGRRRQPLARVPRRADDDLLRAGRRRAVHRRLDQTWARVRASAPTSASAPAWSVYGGVGYQVDPRRRRRSHRGRASASSSAGRRWRVAGRGTEARHGPRDGAGARRCRG